MTIVIATLGVNANVGQRPFFRSGDYWYRNVEFGRPMLDPKKGRRNGGVITDGFTYKQVVPDHYFGYYTTLGEYNQQFGTSISDRKSHGKPHVKTRHHHHALGHGAVGV